ncbi:MAG: ATP-binding protein [Lachnospiraceae bacterium]|nr:ATP-binding protein [Candidatus Colinaster scatohippi]
MSDFGIIGKWNTVPSAELTAELTAKYEDALNAAGIPLKTVMNLCVVFDEIYANICKYSEATDLLLTIEKNDESVRIIFDYNGVLFDPTKREEVDTTKSIEEREIGGLGIHIVKKMTDSMTYECENGRNRLTLIKKF